MKYVYSLEGEDVGGCDTCGPEIEVTINRYCKETKKQLGYIGGVNYQEIDFEVLTEEQWLKTHRT